MADQGDIYELEQLAIQPGTYFNPQTEVIVIVDDSTSVDQDVFNMEEFEGAEWVRISDEVPVDEAILEEAMESFQSTYHPTGGSVTAAALDPDEPEADNATLEPDLDLDDDDDEV